MQDTNVAFLTEQTIFQSASTDRFKISDNLQLLLDRQYSRQNV